ncbi:hypothetical protein CAMRE0001_1047 [Campylobacter rectus RM3267]|uniref:Uncharacterized protein n=2 Tax=Campylobacter rectus TaxID=203 RepID=A0A6G5QLY1_CAMRE|nr:hypothetical protein CAMRE0001_1047 [Campylobacter rectus RM3267]QCD46486.1 hypothetical protein CRECT_0807 [Campylobacter rectus]
MLNLNAYFGKPYLPALIADNHRRLLCGARGIFFIYLARGESKKSMKLKNKIQTSSAVRTSGRCRPKKGLIANNERMLFAVTELGLSEAKRRRPSARRVRSGLFIRVVNFHSDLSLFKEKFFYNWLKI